MTAPDKSDWHLFQSRLPQWQEAYTARLRGDSHTGPYRGSDAFWEVNSEASNPEG